MLRLCSAIVLALVPLVVSAADFSGTVRVIDGDTLDVGDVRVRLFAIDAPESDQMCATRDGTVFACGLWVRNEVGRRYSGATARCRARDRDRYGRVVATCEVRGTDIGQSLVADGLAFAYRRYGMDYDLDEKAAAVNGRGLHGYLVQSPAAFRRAGRQEQPQPQTDAAAGQSCVIKGNISSKGERIYHMPGQEHYARTRINTAKGERWFCSADEARRAGWRRARR